MTLQPVPSEFPSEVRQNFPACTAEKFGCWRKKLKNLILSIFSILEVIFGPTKKKILRLCRLWVDKMIFCIPAFRKRKWKYSIFENFFKNLSEDSSSKYKNLRFLFLAWQNLKKEGCAVRFPKSFGFAAKKNSFGVFSSHESETISIRELLCVTSLHQWGTYWWDWLAYISGISCRHITPRLICT